MKFSKVLIILFVSLIIVFIGLIYSIKISQKRINFYPDSTASTIIITVIPTLNKTREKAKVAYAVDGDTIELTDKRRVRYIGLNTPEMNFGKGKPACFAADAAKVNKELVTGQEIEMEKDVSDKDKYARLLRYIYIDGLLINDFLLRQGYARLELIPPDTHLSLQFKAAVKEAKENKRGLWGKCKNSY